MCSFRFRTLNYMVFISLIILFQAQFLGGTEPLEDDDDELYPPVNIAEVRQKCLSLFPIDLSVIQALQDTGSLPDENAYEPKVKEFLVARFTRLSQRTLPNTLRVGIDCPHKVNYTTASNKL